MFWNSEGSYCGSSGRVGHVRPLRNIELNIENRLELMDDLIHQITDKRSPVHEALLSAFQILCGCLTNPINDKMKPRCR